MANRFFAESPIAGDQAELSGSEAHHAIHVMRLGIGDSITLFDGTGMEYHARIEHADRRRLGLSILDCRLVDRELPFTLSLAVALPKGDRQRWLIEKATELGVTRLIPLVTARGVAQPSTSSLKRLRRTVVEASKQCGRNVLMRIEESLTWTACVSSLTKEENRWVAHPSSEGLSLAAARRSRAATQSLVVAIGPEGGFTPAEIREASAAGWKIVSLGPRLLRIETAAIAIASAVVS